MKTIGWIGIVHVAIIVLWMIFHIIFENVYSVTIDETLPAAQRGLEYYKNLPGYLGMDHGSKALIMFISILLPIGLFLYLQKLRKFHLHNLIALIAGCLGFAIYGISLMLQAVTVEYAFELYRSSEDVYAHSFAMYLYDWAMLEGGFSVSLYILANLCLGCWIILHSYGLYQTNVSKLLFVFGGFTGALMIIGYIASWFFLMQAKQIMHDINEAVGLLFYIWIIMISVNMLRGKIVCRVL